MLLVCVCEQSLLLTFFSLPFWEEDEKSLMDCHIEAKKDGHRPPSVFALFYLLAWLVVTDEYEKIILRRMK